MKFTKRALSLVIALVVLLSTVVIVSSIPTSAVEDNNAAYIIRPNKDSFVKWEDNAEIQKQTEIELAIEKNNDTAKREIVYNEDGSTTIKKPKELFGAFAEYKLDASADAAYAKAKDGKVDFKVRIDYTRDANGFMMDTQAFVILKFKDGTMKSVSRNFMDHYQEKTYSFALVDKEGNALANLSTVDSVIFGAYHYNPYDTQIVFDGLIANGTGVGTIPAFPEPVVKDGETKAVIVDFENTYRQSYSNGPGTLRYSDKKPFSMVSSDYSSSKSGSMYWANINKQDQNQAFFKFNRDVANYGLAVANQEGGAKKAMLTSYLVESKEGNGNDVTAEFVVEVATYDKGYVKVISEWQKPGTVKKYTFDTTQFATNSIQGIKVAYQNYWYKAEDGNWYNRVPVYADDDTEKKTVLYYNYEDVKGKVVGNTNDGKKYVRTVMETLKAYVSNISVNEEEGGIITTPKTEKTTEFIGDYIHAGYKANVYSIDQMDETFGSAPNQVGFMDEKGETIYSLKDKAIDGKPKVVEGDAAYLEERAKFTAEKYYPGPFLVSLKSPERIGEQHQMGFFVSSKAEIKTYEDHAETLKKDKEQKDAYEKALKRVEVAKTKKYDNTEILANAIKYANEHPDPSLKGLLGIDVRVNSAALGDPKMKGVFVQFQVMLHGGENATQMLNVYEEDFGKVKTMYVDVSEVDANDIRLIRVVAQNYFFYDSKAKKYTGLTDLDIDYSAFYVPGKDTRPPPPPPPPTDNEKQKAIKKAFDKIPGDKEEDYLIDGQYLDMNKFLLLEDFIMEYASATDPDKAGVAEKYKITEAVYGKYHFLWTDLKDYPLPPNGGPGNQPMGAATGSVVALLTLAGAGFVFAKARRKNQAI